MKMPRTGSYRVCKQFPVRRLVIATLAAELQLILSHAAAFSQADRHSVLPCSPPPPSCVANSFLDFSADWSQKFGH